MFFLCLALAIRYECVRGCVSYTIQHVIKGDTTEEVLRFMQYDPDVMMDSIRTQSESALKLKRMNLAQYRLLMRHFEKALRAYTYLWVRGLTRVAHASVSSCISVYACVCVLPVPGR